ncbi:dnaJ homolog subfamily B member 7-like isoform X1 [Juglans microcarpa x Juglans regia]|uniref:dnaJ homolog subfamily B member 7-like isoform X1 n=1 Tax=Juglans microcarpa x Juglans regia TaxID=2249226 RepID=UPI001B7E1F7E|nr:dnaJ homolog subfamily B member 7-like isoform X1 [Juglans microcarpa x Juglans regia]
MQMEADKEPLSYYGVLGVGMNSSAEELRRAYRKLAMQWHPDRWLKTPSLLGQAKRKFQQIQEAYSVLSDQRKRTLYDAGLYDPDDEQDEGFSDFLQEMVSLMKQTRKEKKNYSLEELQRMLVEMAQGFDSPTWSCGPSIVGNSGCSKRTRWETDQMPRRSSRLHASSLGMSGSSGCCN